MLKTLPSQDYKIIEYTSQDIIYRYKKNEKHITR